MTVAMMVDSDAGSRQRFTRLLEGEGLTVIQASDGAEALALTFEAKPEVAVVALEVNVGGTNLISILRAACPIPIVALAPCDDSAQVVQALDSGADDVLVRNCASVEFLARVRVAMRRVEVLTPGTNASARIVRTGDLTIDRDARTVTKLGQHVPLSRTEYLMVDVLASRLGEVAPHRYLLSEIWGEAFVDDVHYLRVYIGYLRQKLEDDPTSPQYFVNDWGVGYRLARLPVAIAGGNRQVTRLHSMASAIA